LEREHSDTKQISRLMKPELQAAQKDLRAEARDKSMSGDVLSEYVDVRRLSATKDMSFFSRLLVSCLRNSLTKSSDTGENLISGFGPDKWLGIVVSEFDILFDGLFQFQRAAMGRTFDLFFRE